LIEAALNRVWYGDGEPGVALRGLERLYRRRLEARRRRGLAHRCEALAERPVIVVGNITAGGTGKTPLVIRLCELLTAAGLRPGVVSRGYGRSSRGPVQVTSQTSAAEAGDEPLLIARRCGIPVRVDEDREAAALALFEAGVELVIADDGLQRWRLPRDLEFCVIDGQRGFGNGHLLPAGPLREPLERLERVDYLVVNGGSLAEPLATRAIPMELRPGDFHRLGGLQTLGVAGMLDHCSARGAHAIAGIGNPQRFFGQLAALGLSGLREHAFADHHDYRPADLAGLQGTLVMTEKDALKCAGLELADAWYLPVDARLPPDWEAGFVARALALVEEKSP